MGSGLGGDVLDTQGIKGKEGCTMKVKVGKRVYDSQKLPIMLVLTEGEREQIAEMAVIKSEKGDTVLVSAP
jgi:hypothetical protein